MYKQSHLKINLKYIFGSTKLSVTQRPLLFIIIVSIKVATAPTESLRRHMKFY